MDWAQVLTVFAIVATNLITVITLHIHLDSKTDKNILNINEKTEKNILAMNERTEKILQSIALEMKDFHGRLIAIEERNKNKG